MSTPSPGDDGGTATTVVYFGRDELVIRQRYEASASSTTC